MSEMKSRIKDDAETLEKNTDKGLTEVEMVELEGTNGEMEKSFTEVFGGLKQPNGRVVILEEWNEVMDGKMEKHLDLALIELREKRLCVQLGVNSEERAIKFLALLLEKEWKKCK
ncbi:Hypothetical predicted protein [Podarcis lilfordi]|uniref:Uncharacterized protein n=1 Tax=Podarcis lilfordi TaxID=74358 RepID=A0AA35LD10_9SAUR|nr:Hypothetical predicted protein [Podarcis lilfordi]